MLFLSYSIVSFPMWDIIQKLVYIILKHPKILNTGEKRKFLLFKCFDDFFSSTERVNQTFVFSFKAFKPKINIVCSLLFKGNTYVRESEQMMIIPEMKENRIFNTFTFHNERFPICIQTKNWWRNK